MTNAQNLLCLAEKAGYSKSFQLLFEIVSPHYFLRLKENVDVRKVLSTKDHDGIWVEKEEIWGLVKDDDTPITAAYTPSGDYIGDPKTAKMLVKKGITSFEKTEPNHCVVSIGFNPEENKWYGWSHRAIYGFGVGGRCKVGDCGFIPSNPDDFIDSLKSFYKNSDFKKDEKDSQGNLGVLVVGKGPKKVTHFEIYPEWGKGEWTAETLDDAKQMAIDFAKGVS